MPDVYADITAAEPAVLETLIAAMESRASDPRQRAIRDALFTAAALSDGARVLEAGCGSGAVSRELARRPGIAAVVGLDPSPVFLSRARVRFPRAPPTTRHGRRCPARLGLA